MDPIISSSKPVTRRAACLLNPKHLRRVPQVFPPNI